MRTTALKKIKNGDKEFELEFTQLAPSKSLKFMIFMGKFVGGSAGKAMGAFNGSKASMQDLANLKDEDFNFEKIGDAISKIVGNLDEDEVIQKLDVLFESVSYNGEEIHIDHFMFDGNPMLIFEVARKALEVNYKRFLDENSGLVGKLIKSVKVLANTQK